MKIITEKTFTELISFKKNYIYKCNNRILFIQDYKSWEKYKLWVFSKSDSFNLQSPLEYILLNISNFYEALNGIEDEYFTKLLISSRDVSKYEFEMHGWEEMWDYAIYNDVPWWTGNIGYREIIFWFERWALWWHRWVEVSWEMTYKEFYLLMQIYFWVYQESELLKTCEEKEKNWVYEWVKDLDHTAWKNNPLFEEYLKLKLMQKDTTGAFNWLQIEKIYDKDWAEEKQKEHIDEINKELGEEVIVWE